MTAKGKLAKEKIIKVTTQLVDTEADTKNISIRRISRLAGISLSSINYYFQTKDKLIEESVRIRVNRVMKQWLDLERSLNVDPVAKFRIYIHNLGEFMARHPKVMQVSILNVYSHYEPDDSLTYFHEKDVIPLLKSICPDKSEQQIKIVISLCVDSIYLTLLRRIHYPEKCVCDFFNQESRNKYLDILVDSTVLVLRSIDSV